MERILRFPHLGLLFQKAYRIGKPNYKIESTSFENFHLLWLWSGSCVKTSSKSGRGYVIDQYVRNERGRGTDYLQLVEQALQAQLMRGQLVKSNTIARSPSFTVTQCLDHIS